MVLLSADPSSSRQVSDNYDDILSHLVTSEDGHLHWSQPPIWPEDELTSFNKGPSIGSVLRAARPWRPIEANVDDIVPAEELLDADYESLRRPISPFHNQARPAGKDGRQGIIEKGTQLPSEWEPEVLADGVNRTKKIFGSRVTP